MPVVGVAENSKREACRIWARTFDQLGQSDNCSMLAAEAIYEVFRDYVGTYHSGGVGWTSQHALLQLHSDVKRAFDRSSSKGRLQCGVILHEALARADTAPGGYLPRMLARGQQAGWDIAEYPDPILATILVGAAYLLNAVGARGHGVLEAPWHWSLFTNQIHLDDQFISRFPDWFKDTEATAALAHYAPVFSIGNVYEPKTGQGYGSQGERHMYGLRMGRPGLWPPNSHTWAPQRYINHRLFALSRKWGLKPDPEGDRGVYQACGFYAHTLHITNAVFRAWRLPALGQRKVSGSGGTPEKSGTLSAQLARHTNSGQMQRDTTFLNAYAWAAFPNVLPSTVNVLDFQLHEFMEIEDEKGTDLCMVCSQTPPGWVARRAETPGGQARRRQGPDRSVRR